MLSVICCRIHLIYFWFCQFAIIINGFQVFDHFQFIDLRNIHISTTLNLFGMALLFSKIEIIFFPDFQKQYNSHSHGEE